MLTNHHFNVIRNVYERHQSMKHIYLILTLLTMTVVPLYAAVKTPDAAQPMDVVCENEDRLAALFGSHEDCTQQVTAFYGTCTANCRGYQSTNVAMLTDLLTLCVETCYKLTRSAAKKCDDCLKYPA